MGLSLWRHCNSLLANLSFSSVLDMLPESIMTYSNKYINRKPLFYTRIEKSKFQKPCVFYLYFKMYLLYILPVVVIVTKGLLIEGNAVNLTDAIHGFPGHNVDPADIIQTMQIMMQMFLNQTAEIEHLKQQTEKIENMKLQSENDRSTIQTLQNRVFFLEAGQNELSKLPSSQEFSTYLSGMNHLTQNSVAYEAIIRNLTQQLNDVVSALNDLQLNEISTTQQLNGSLVNVKRDVQDLIASMLIYNETEFETTAVESSYLRT